MGMLRQHELAFQSFERAVQVQPDNAVAWMNRGMSLEMLQRYEDSLNSFDKAVEINPQLAKAWNYRGKIQIQ